ncbi:SsrA-binding protein SmpB [Candidatus Absconditicoccus praedator]|uniref:SsrA-binding protein SmpB n=1 Tax=Candidatus Absconditicoccus praedator TaxID=2735562 RepID=UPI001E418D4D|nr:SsrA-binding protein SmpB [Candidatus Absconditicoccus praedator]UFX82967.1 SsrA-binding protein SmpB [Candidatus Absconditicoccus praedator]
MKIITKNKYAYLNYDIHEKFESGVVLKGFETKAVKLGKVNIKDSFIQVRGGEIFILNMDIPLYNKTSFNIVPWYDSKRNRKLLMKKPQIARLYERTKKTGLVLIPLKVYENKRKLVKIEIGLAKLRKKVEKKQIIKERDIQRQASKDIKRLKI